MSEVAWSRMLVVVIGNTVMATSIVVMTFMGGLSLGSYCGARLFRKYTTSILPYTILELCIGCYVIFSFKLFPVLSGMFLSIAPFWFETPFLNGIRVTFVLFFLFMPAFLMGATFPAMLLSVPLKYSNRSASHAGYLYSINTLGATCGCIIAGYGLLPKHGVQLTLVSAGLLNIIVCIGGIIIYVLERNNAKSFSLPNTQQVAGSPALGSHILRYVASAIFCVGFVALSYQVLLVRMIMFLVGNVTSVFTLVVAAFLLATGISALIGTRVHDIVKRAEYLFVVVIMAAGLLIVVPVFLILGMFYAPFMRGVSTTSAQIMIFFIILIPIFFIGSLLPIAIKLFSADEHNTTAFSAGKLYAVNTCGGVLGAGFTNSFLVPVFGVQGVLCIFAIVFLIIGLVFLILLKISFLKRNILIGVVVFLSLLILMLPGKVENLYVSFISHDFKEEGVELKLFHEGKAATITILDAKREGRLLFLNGVEEVSTRFYHVQLFKTLGMLPLLLQESDVPRDVLVVAFGAGITSGAVLDTGLASSLEVVDLVPEAEKINDLFKDINGDVFNSPKCKFIPEDGRNYLLINPKKYGAIISDATHPFAYDSWTLYTREFYQQIKDHLLHDGIFVQWIPLSLQDEFFKIILRTIKDVFPHITFWNIYGSDQGFIMATSDDFSFDMKRIQERLDKMSLRDKGVLKSYKLSRAEDFASFFVMDESMIAATIKEEQRINTDNFSYNDIFDLKDTAAGGQSLVPIYRYQVSILPYLKNVADKQKRDIKRRQELAQYMQRFYYYKDMDAFEKAREIDPQDGIVSYYLRDAGVIVKE